MTAFNIYSDDKAVTLMTILVHLCEMLNNTPNIDIWLRKQSHLFYWAIFIMMLDKNFDHIGIISVILIYIFFVYVSADYSFNS